MFNLCYLTEFQKGSDDSIVMVLNYIIFLNFMGFVLFLCLFVCLFVKVSLCSPSCSETLSSNSEVCLPLPPKG